ncbi:MAG TPA: hypothetical protein VJH03_21235 [Blastocatellia bacterium]|nr:hypothetical protein [Blastocatellia bacterium]
MTDWVFAQTDPSEELALLHYFSMKKRQPDGDVEFIITVREYVGRNPQNMRFFAQADKQTNQKTAPFTPFGWGESLLQALSECVRAIHRFPYEGRVD